jgi:hypothetical protein
MALGMALQRLEANKRIEGKHMMDDVRDEFRRAAAPAAVNAWREAQADFASALRFWGKPLSREVERMVEATEDAFGSGWIWQALEDGWSIVDLFGYGANEATQTADFGVVTGIGLGMFWEILFVEGNLAILKVVAEIEPPAGKVSFRYDRRIMDGNAMVVWWRHRRLDPGPGRFTPPPLDDVLGRLVG